MQEHPTTTEGIIESTTDQQTVASRQSTMATGRASAGSQSTPSKLTSIPTSASRTSSEPSPNTSSPGAKSDNVTRTDVSTGSRGTHDPAETTYTAANSGKTNTSAAPNRTFTASTSTTNQTENPATAQSSATASASTHTAEPPSSTPYVWIGVLVVGVVGTLVSTVVFVLAFLRIICAPKQSLGPNVISKELDRTLL